MWNLQLVALTLAMSSTLASAAIFPKDTTVKMLDAKGFRKAMKTNDTMMIAFVAPWCGHCQRMAPEYSKAALGLYPLVPTYAVDCDADANKPLCAKEGVQGFPTIKLYPRGKHLGSMTYESERSASGFFYWASRRVPNHIKRLGQVDEIQPWVEKSAEIGRPRALLLTKEKKTPLLWSVLGNKFAGEIELATHRDRKGKASVAMGYEVGEKKSSKVIIYAPNSTTPVRYEGINKLDSLTKFFKSVIDGTADLSVANKEAASEEFVVDEAELEIERKKEAQRIALAHGGFGSLIDFEDAMKKGYNPHGDSYGYPGMMGDAPKQKAAEGASESKTEAAESTVEAGKAEGQAAFAASPAEEPAPTATPEPSEAVKEKAKPVAEPEPASPPKDEL